MRRRFQLTEKGLDNLKAELVELVSQTRTTTERMRLAQGLSDLSENAEYVSARQEHDRLMTRIAYVESILQNVSIIRTHEGGAQKVQLGSTVELRYGDDVRQQFQVVGTLEADPLSGKISDESPLGRELLNKAVGDTAELKTPSGVIVYVICAIN